MYKRQAQDGSKRTLLQGIMSLKHMAANSLEQTAPFNRHNFDAGAAHGVDPFVLADYYLVPFRSAIRDADARGIMCRRVTLAPLRCLHVALSPGALLAQLQRRAGRAHLPLPPDAQRA